MCIDKRSGRLVYHKDDLPGTNVPLYDLFCDPQAHTVTVSLPTWHITLTYTNEPADPQAVRKAAPRGRAVDRALVRAARPREPAALGFALKDAISR